MTKLVFLDVDGVLNTSSTWGTPFCLSPDLCENLAGILYTCQTNLVVSSDWRLEKDGVGPSSSFQRQLSHCCPKYFNFIVSRLIGHTGSSGTREDQILEFANLAKVDKFVALDDKLQLYPSIPEWLVLTNPAEGLTLQAATAAIHKLNSK